MTAVHQVPESIKKALVDNRTAWVDDTVFLRDKNPLVATHTAQNGRQCAMVDGRWVYTQQRIEDGGYDAVGGINLPATLIVVVAKASAAS